MRNLAEIVVPEALAGLGAAGAALDAEGDLALELSGHQVLVSHREQPLDALWITVGVGPAPRGELDALRWLLKAAGELWLGRGLALGLDGSGEHLCCRLAIPTSLVTADALAEAMTDAVAVAGALRETLAARHFDTPATASEGAPPPSGFA